jgi:hypothetical protein
MQNVEHDDKVDASLLDYYIKAAVVAIRLGIGLQYAFDRYVKPHMPPRREIKPIRPDQEWIFGDNF